MEKHSNGASRLAGAVAVVTGASSGIGRQTAVELARIGCRVACAARRAREIDETVSLCREAGSDAIAVVTDVTREEDVRHLTEATLERWGRIDVWINNAGITLFAPLWWGPFAEHRRVIETNVLGAMLSARSAIPVFRRQRHGVLVNVGSVLSKVGHPFVPAYAISKFALRGMSDSLRIELADEPDVQVCTIFPYAIDTPHFQTGANEMGWRARAMPPVQSPERIARAIVELAARPRREVHVPRAALLGLALRWAFPETTERLVLHALQRWHFDDVREVRTPGNLYAPLPAEHGEVHGARRPQVSTARFAGWLLGDLLQMSTEPVRRRLRRRGPERRSVSASKAPLEARRDRVVGRTPWSATTR